MIYCDTSFLVALYVERDFFHKQAVQTIRRWQGPIPFTLLSELELQNSVRRCLVRKDISVSEHDSIFRQIVDDEFQGFLIRQPVSQADHYAMAREVSKRHTPQLSSRSLDILQVAAALLLNASPFASFDIRQRQLAAAAGLQVIPKQLVKSQASA